MKKKSPYPWRYIIPTFIGTTLGGVAMALLIREDKSYVKQQMVLESAVIKWLKEMGEYERVLLEEREEKPIIEGVKPMCTAFGIDIYELNGELYPEEEYGRLQKV